MQLTIANLVSAVKCFRFSYLPTAHHLAGTGASESGPIKHPGFGTCLIHNFSTPHTALPCLCACLSAVVSPTPNQLCLSVCVRPDGERARWCPGGSQSDSETAAVAVAAGAGRHP